MFYPITIKKTEDGQIFASSPDMPQCVFAAESLEEALKNGAGAIPAAMELFYRRKRLPIPMPSTGGDSDVPVYVPARVQAKILLWNTLCEKGLKLADLARMMKISQAQAQRYVDLTKDKASMEAIEEALSALGCHLSLTVHKDDDQ